MKRRVFLIVLIACLLSAALCLSLSADSEPFSWSFENGWLTLSGSGPMPDYSAENPVPWADVKNQIVSVSIGSELTTIGAHAFEGCENLNSVAIPRASPPSAILLLLPATVLPLSYLRRRRI